MKNWKKTMWRSELKKLIVDSLKSGDMTIQELITAIQASSDVKIQHSALAAILKVTDGVVVTTKRFSAASNRMINVYSVPLPLDKKQ